MFTCCAVDFQIFEGLQIEYTGRKSVMLKFVLLVNKQGQTRLSQYYEYIPVEERVTTEADIVRKCLARNEDAVSKLLLR